MFSRRVLAVSALAVAAIVVARPGAQQPDPLVFRGGVNAVLLDLRVVDAEGHFVRDLTLEDFRVLEDGREQKVTTFKLVDLPPIASDAIVLDGARIEPDVISNLDPDDGRLYVIVMDDRVLDGDIDERVLRSPVYRAIAREFIEHHVGDADRTALVSTSGRTDFSLDFTSNRQLLLAAVDRFEAGYGRVDRFTLRNTLRSMTEVAEWLSRIEGRRKTIVLISENMGIMNPEMVGAPLSAVSDETMAEGDYFRDMIVAANRGNVTINVLDPVGYPGATAGAIKPIFVGGNPEMNLFRRARLQMMAESTGGFALTASNAFVPAMERIVAESSAYYLLGYSSTNTKRDGKFRSLHVTVTPAGLKVQARVGYVADKPKPAAPGRNQGGLSPAVAKLIQSPLPVSGLPMRISSVAIRGKGDKAAVTMVVETVGRDLRFTERNGRQVAGLSFVTTAADQDAHVRASERTNITYRLSPPDHAAAVKDSVRFLARMQLKPGRYQVKVAGQETTGSRQGVVLYDLAVPDFSRGAVSMTAVALGSTGTKQLPTYAADAAWPKTLGMMPTTRREFEATDELQVYAEVYDNTKAGSSLEAATTVQRESGEFVYGAPGHSSVLESDGTTMRRITATIPLQPLGPGRYVLTLTARSSAEPEKPVSRQVPFEVRSEK